MTIQISAKIGHFVHVMVVQLVLDVMYNKNYTRSTKMHTKTIDF